MINLNESFAPEEQLPAFIPGQVVYHVNYAYRGLVVDSDPTCQAPDAWYQSNQTQPNENQFNPPQPDPIQRVLISPRVLTGKTNGQDQRSLLEVSDLGIHVFI